MKVSLNWLKKYVNINIPDDELIRLIGARLVEVEGVIDETHKYDNIYVVKVEKAEKIPDTHLTLCQINTGDITSTGGRSPLGTRIAEGKAGGTPIESLDEMGETARTGPVENLVQVVCGAPNVREGMLAAWIAPGAIVPASVHEDAPFVIGKRKMMGYESNGMLAGADELDFDDKHEKIVEIDPGMAKPGDLLADIFNLNDKILEIENKSLTHRPDCFGIIGFAREIAGILGQKFNEPDFLWQEDTFPKDYIELNGNSIRRKNTDIKINIADQNLCPRYTCAEIKVIDATKPIEYLTKMQILLAKSGMHTNSKIVDVTNYLMLLTGQPLHAFDCDKFLVVGKTRTPNIIIRAAKPGEKITLLDESEIECNENDILITSNNIPVALAGAMGGKSTAIDENTKHILLESATFSLYNLRKTQMAHGIFSEAITRFTKGIPAGDTYNVLAEAVKEIGAKPLDLNDSWPGYQEGNVVKITTPEINSLLGTNYNNDLIKGTLENVGFSITLTGDTMIIQAPSWRTDIHIKEDIIEEVGRLLGYDNITPTLPLHATSNRNNIWELKKDIRNIMLRFGANELLTYSFVSEKLLEKSAEDPKNSYKIINSISPDLQYVRQSIIPSLLDKTFINEKLPVDKFAIYEMNQVYHKDWGETKEKVPRGQNQLGFVIAERKNLNTAFYQAKFYAARLLEELHISAEFLPFKEGDSPANYYEPKRTAEIWVNNERIGYVGEFKNSIKHNFKLADYLAGFEFNLDLILKLRGQKQINTAKLIKQEDITITTKKTYSEIEKELQAKYTNAIITPGQVYQPDGSSEKNLTFHLKFYQS